jgi:hypothetical protein
VLWEQLAAEIPYVRRGAPRRTSQLYVGMHITCEQPGKYAVETGGGDFRVDYRGRGPTHLEKFALVEAFSGEEQDARQLRDDLLEVIHLGACPERVADRSTIRGTAPFRDTGIDWVATLAVFQAVALAEDRRYRTAPRGGGRYLPFNFARLMLGRWAGLEQVVAQEKTGLPGLAELERAVSAAVPPASRQRLTSRGWSASWWGIAHGR